MSRKGDVGLLFSVEAHLHTTLLAIAYYDKFRELDLTHNSKHIAAVCLYVAKKINEQFADSPKRIASIFNISPEKLIRLERKTWGDYNYCAAYPDTFLTTITSLGATHAEVESISRVIVAID